MPTETCAGVRERFIMWYGQINRTIWEIEKLLKKTPGSFKLKKELLRASFLQRYEYDRNFHIPRDDRTFLFLQEGPSQICLLLHGAQGTPAEMRELGGYLYSRGFSVYCPRLLRVDMKDRPVSWESWVTDADRALTTVLEYSNEANMIGLSLGSTIAIQLCGMHKVSKIVMLSPALYPKLGFKEWLQNLGKKLLPTLFFHLAGWNGEVIKAMEFVRNRPKKIEAPILVLQAQDDLRLSSRGLKWLRRCAVHSRSEVVLLPRGSHVLTRGVAKEEVYQRVYSFLQNN